MSTSSSLQQRIAHKVNGDIIMFQAPVEVLDSGDKVVMLQSILELFPDTVALCRKDKRFVSFLTNPEGVLLVPIRVAYSEDETYFVVPSSGPRSPPPPPPPLQPSLSHHHQQTEPTSIGSPQPTMQQQTLPIDSVAVQLITQDMTIVNMPVPRLFIILPDPKPRDWNETMSSSLSTPLLRTYRLYFLCDCGPGFTFPRVTYDSSTGSLRDPKSTNVMNNNDTVDHCNCIHIADQQGYGIVNLQQYANLFGEYTLLLLKAFQQGIDATVCRGSVKQSKIILPTLSQRHYRDVRQPFTWDIEERVSTAITDLESLTLCNNNKNDNHGTHSDIPTVNLHRLWECVDGLKSGKGYKVQPMRCMAVNDGTVRWLCESHYQSSFSYVSDDRDMFLWRCQEILGDEGDLLTETNVQSKNSSIGSGKEDNDAPLQAVAFDYHKMHLRLSGSIGLRQIAALKAALKTAYMVQQISLTIVMPSGHELMAITDLISDSTISIWNLSLVAIKNNSKIPSPLDTSPSFFSQNHSDNASTPSMPTPNDLHTILHAFHTLFVLGNLKSLQIPDLDGHLYRAFSPGLNDYPHLSQLHLRGSNSLGQANLKNSGATWFPIRPGTLLKAFGQLTELRISNIYLGNYKRKPSDNPSPLAHFPLASLYELVEALVYLPHLSILELSACGLLKENCSILARSFSVLDASQITHLDIHDNWLDDTGLAELLWAVGPRLISLDARNCGFGNESAFALASILQAHNYQADQQQLRSNVLQSHAMSIFRVLKLEELYNPHLRYYFDTCLNDESLPSIQRVPNHFTPQGREHFIQALGLLQPVELCVRLDMGFRDIDFASVFTRMTNPHLLSSLERLDVSCSQFGPWALTALIQAFKTMTTKGTCRIRELGLQTTLLSAEQQQDAVQQILGHRVMRS
ncbi:hypothetical protein FBU30_001526 [Linnemannia zychae]|nr:hypothetical protein FBU30_001526 [Linnemannia zychae]